MILQLFQTYDDYWRAYNQARLYSMLWWLIPLIIWGILGTICALVVYFDAKGQRRMNATLWALIAFIAPIIGIIIYFAIKTNK